MKINRSHTYCIVLWTPKLLYKFNSVIHFIKIFQKRLFSPIAVFWMVRSALLALKFTKSQFYPHPRNWSMSTNTNLFFHDLFMWTAGLFPSYTKKTCFFQNIMKNSIFILILFKSLSKLYTVHNEYKFNRFIFSRRFKFGCEILVSASAYFSFGTITAAVAASHRDATSSAHWISRNR